MVNLVEAINKGLKKEDNIHEFYVWARESVPKIQREFDPTVLHTSDLGVYLDGDDETCHRQVWLRLNEKESKDSTLGERIMWDHGLRIQIRFSYILSLGLPQGWNLKNILVVYGESSESDLVLEDPDDNSVVVEMKTARGKAFDYMEDAKPRHIMQCQDYMRREDTDEGYVLYIDREGQNKPMQFPVERNDERCEEAWGIAKEIEQMEMQPPKIDNADIKIRKNKSKDHSVYVDLCWQCEYCDFYKFSCDGVLDEDQINSGIVGRIDDDGNFYSEEYGHLEDLYAELVCESEEYHELMEEIEDDGDD